MARSTVTRATTILLLFASSTFARVVNYNLDIANGQVSPDGVTRNAVLVNNRFPGPLIAASKGDTLKVTVNNRLTDPTMRLSTTIHWHGLFQSRTAQEDGPAFVTQCPIAPNDSYTYTIPLNDQTGTYWYHSHLSSQYVDGLRGPLVIYPQDPYLKMYDVDDENTIFTLADWYHTPSQVIVAANNVLATIPDSGTINGKGRYGPLILTTTPKDLYTLRVQQGKRYRLRIINASAIASFRFSIQGHKMTVIEVDGIMTQPVVVDQLDILAAQRYSVILEANQAADTYWINAPSTNLLNTNVQALLVYGSPKISQLPTGSFEKWNASTDIVEYWKHTHGHHGEAHKRRLVNGDVEKRADVVVLDESKLAPLVSPGAPGGARPADIVVPLFFDLNFLQGRWRINGISYKSPDLPTLLKILSKQNTVSASDFSTAEHTYILPRDKVVELSIRGLSLGIVHPFHLHGHAFDVVQYGNAPPNYVNPPRRDVVGVTDAGVRIQFKTDNPGPWFLHCHIDWHLEEGLAMVFAEAPDAMKSGPQSINPDPAWKNLCDRYSALPKDQQ